MEHITLFTDILPEEQERMRVCFKVREKVFQNGETIMEYSSSMKKIGLIQEGRAVLYCCDEEGNEYVIDELNKDSVFGEPFLLPSDSQYYYVCATTVTKVLFIDYEHVIKRCENACHHHSQMVSNLLQMTALRSRQQTDRIYMLSRSSTRKKLIAYLHSLAAEKNAGKFKLPMSYTALAQYLSVDRSAMMREIKNLSDEGVIRRNGRNVELLAYRIKPGHGWKIRPEKIIMNVTVRKYEEKDLPDLIRIWNEVVEDGVAFPQEECLNEETGKAFFSEQTYTAAAVDAESGKVYGLCILHPNNIGRCGHICNASYAVSRDSRGLHIGEKLVSDCLTREKSMVLVSCSLMRLWPAMFLQDIFMRDLDLPSLA